MPDKVLNQIKYLCKEIPKEEWSGVLFYSIEGTIKEPSKMKITLEDILPMHKGTSAYTEYTFDERVIDHMMNNEYLENCRIGHIHSHNTMGVFFSGTDWSELEDNAPNHNLYLSLIVNNYMDFCAKVCFIAEFEEPKEFDLKAKDENGNLYSYQKVEYNVEDKKLIVYDCDVLSSRDVLSIEDTFKANVENIIKKAEAKSVVTTFQSRPMNPNYTPPYVNNNEYSWGSNMGIEHVSQEEIKRSQNLGKNTKKDVEEEIDYNSMIEDFTLLLLNAGKKPTKGTIIEDILEEIHLYNIDGKGLAVFVLENYTKLYNQFFSNLMDRNEEETFIALTQMIIENIQVEAELSNLSYGKSLLEPVANALSKLLVYYEGKN